MARCVFFSFHFEDSWKVNQVRNANVVHGVDKAGYIDHSEYLEAERKGDAALKRLIDQKIERTTVTVVLIGHRTAYRSWVRYEIDKSIERGNGLLGIYIHRLRDPTSMATDRFGRSSVCYRLTACPRCRPSREGWCFLSTSGTPM